MYKNAEQCPRIFKYEIKKREKKLMTEFHVLSI